MKSLFLKLFTSASIKTGIAYALNVVTLVASALSGVLSGDGISDERRRQIGAILVGVVAVREFLSRLALIVGAPSNVGPSSLEDIVSKSDALDRITDAL